MLYGHHKALDDISLSVPTGCFMTLLGPSGCGKSTLLKVIAGLQRGHSGTVMLAGRDITQLPPHKRNVGVVFQNYALFPHLSVFENVAFGVRLRRDLAPRADAIVREALDLVRLGDFASRPITALSGGQQQRVAVARSLVVEPSVLLLDEPFSALDRQLREEMQIELRQILRSRDITSIFVTHDQEEAVVMSDRIVVMRNGHVEQEAAPSELYEAPDSVFVLDFVGKSMRLAGTVIGQGSAGSRVKTALGEIQLRSRFPDNAPVWVGVRANRIALDDAGAAPGENENGLPSVGLRDVINYGSSRVAILEGGADDRVTVEIQGSRVVPKAGDACALRWRVEDTLAYPRDGRT